MKRTMTERIAMSEARTAAMVHGYTNNNVEKSAATIGHLIGQTSLSHTISYWSGLGRQM